MYPAKYFQVEEEESLKLIAVINANPLATLMVNVNEALPHVSHIPFHFSECDSSTKTQDKVLIGHISNHHPLAKKLLTQTNIQVSLVFHGEQSYISPHCFDNVNGQVVPTWNYEKVQVSGVVTPVLSPEKKRQQMELSSQYFEREQEKPWKLTELSDKKIQQMLSAITFFKVNINSIEGNFKLSQNKPKQVKVRIAEQLTKKGKDKLAALIL